MLSHYEALTRIKAAKLVAILRHVPTEKLDGVVEALMAGGVRVLEFTFDHDRADCVKENAEKIRHTVEKYGDRVLVGCGTALTVQEVEAAGDAGACLVISPNVDYGVIRRTRQLGMVSMPGALTLDKNSPARSSSPRSTSTSYSREALIWMLRISRPPLPFSFCPHPEDG